MSSLLQSIEPKAVLMFAIGVVVLLWIWAWSRARATGVPITSRIVAVDQRGWEAPTRTYSSIRYGLSGRPDFVVRTKRGLIPIEVKPLRKGRPREGDILQLGAYLLLLEDDTGTRPTRGILKYADHHHHIRNTARLRRKVMQATMQIRQARQAHNANRSHREHRRCRACGLREQCDQALM